MHSAKYFLTGLLSGIITTVIFSHVNNTNTLEIANLDFQKTITEKIVNIDKKIEILNNQTLEISRNQQYITLQPDPENTEIIANNDTEKTNIDLDKKKPLDIIRDIINNKIASNNFNIVQFLNSSETSNISDKDKKALVSEIIHKVNSGQLPIDYILKQHH